MFSVCADSLYLILSKSTKWLLLSFLYLFYTLGNRSMEKFRILSKTKQLIKRKAKLGLRLFLFKYFPSKSLTYTQHCYVMINNVEPVIFWNDHNNSTLYHFRDKLYWKNFISSHTHTHTHTITLSSQVVSKIGLVVLGIQWTLLKKELRFWL